MFWVAIAVVYNLVFNIYLNGWWADGNYWLLWNTAYLVMQGAHSLLLVFEVPFYLRVLKVWRVYNTVAAAVYNFLYVVLSFEWYKMLFLDDVDIMTAGDILLNLMLGYNLVVHFPVAIINF